MKNYGRQYTKANKDKRLKNKRVSAAVEYSINNLVKSISKLIRELRPLILKEAKRIGYRKEILNIFTKDLDLSLGNQFVTSCLNGLPATYFLYPPKDTTNYSLLSAKKCSSRCSSGTTRVFNAPRRSLSFNLPKNHLKKIFKTAAQQRSYVSFWQDYKESRTGRPWLCASIESCLIDYVVEELRDK